jgi:hypothetical protein
VSRSSVLTTASPLACAQSRCVYFHSQQDLGSPNRRIVRANQTTETSRIVHSRSAAIAKSRKSASTITRPDVAVQLRSRIARLPARKSVQMKRCRSPTESGVVSLLYLHGPTSSPKSFHPLADRGISLACRDIGRSSVAKVFGGWIRPAFPVCISLRFPLLCRFLDAGNNEALGTLS